MAGHQWPAAWAASLARRRQCAGHLRRDGGVVAGEEALTSAAATAPEQAAPQEGLRRLVLDFLA